MDELMQQFVDALDIKDDDEANQIIKNVGIAIKNKVKNKVKGKFNQAVNYAKDKLNKYNDSLEEVTAAQEKYRVKPSIKPTQFKQDIAAAKKMIDAGKSEKEVVAKYGQATFNAVNAQNLG